MRKDDWWIRIFDFPRLQVVVFTVFMLIVLLWNTKHGEYWNYFLAFVLFSCIGYQYKKIYPYTWLAKKQVISGMQLPGDSQLSILVANVLTPNRQAAQLLKIIYSKSPDIILTLETDHWWETQLQPLEEDYPFVVKVPQDNLYGMHLYSKLELINPIVKFLIEDNIPSIHSKVKMKTGQLLNLHCLHPAPPSPTENETSTERDAELLVVAKWVQKQSLPTIVAGDLNDVAWSRTTKLFQAISGLLDPRIGRGFFNTFHAKYSLFRWPLDHIFHSTDFTLLSLERLPYFGSDHFPIFARLNYFSDVQILHDEPEADEAEEEWAEEKIKKALVKEK